MALELGFNVNNAGPLSQLSVQIASLDVAVFLATSAWGWYKGRDRALTFEQTLSSKGVSLATTSSFKSDWYSKIRQEHGAIYGAALTRDRTLVRILLPKASTANEGDPGMRCLRAAMVALLCFAEADQVSTILKEVLPRTLLHYEQEGVEFALEGASLASLLHFVTAVAREENVDALRRHILEEVDFRVRTVVGPDMLAEVLKAGRADTAQVIGLLVWILKPNHSKSYFSYPTKSLKVWALAAALHKLGFDVEASNQLVTTPYSPPDSPCFHNGSYMDVPEVILVLSPGWRTDKEAIMSTVGVNAEIKPPPRLVPIRAIPAIAYTRVVAEGVQIDLARLEAAFSETYLHVRKTLCTMPLFCRAVGIPVSMMPRPDMENFNKDMPHYELLEHYLDAKGLESEFDCSQDFFSNPGESQAEIHKLIGPMMLKHMNPEICQNLERMHVVFQHIAFAGVLGAVSLCIHYNRQAWGPEMNMEIAYGDAITLEHVKMLNKRSPLRPDKPSLPQWLSRLGDALYMLRAIFGPDLTMLDQPFAPAGRRERQESRGSALRDLRDKWGALVCQVIVGANVDVLAHPFGAQGYGISAISDFLLYPSLRPSACFVYHYQYGQLLDIPTDQDIVIDGAYKRSSKAIPAELDQSEHLTDIRIVEYFPLDRLRCDIEPCWESDLRKCCLNIRLAGISRVELSPIEVVRSIQPDIHHVTDLSHTSLCERSTNFSVDAIFDRKWYRVPLLDMLSRGQLAISSIEGLVGPKPNWIFHASGSELLAIICLSLGFTPSLKPDSRIVCNCIADGLEKAKSLGYPEKSVMLILISDCMNHSSLTLQ
ncbi:hypothetical protein L228DRAFT_2985 [Xylona heveae TC161]|uniref:Uncharacterized protein n=1 Tax=Xylona heveae (strain CBS 132557 / TC161) TaxID=1328760 RepID=A0A165JB88_XYLHT|nr:hypothetical protein L228DRAFT_2985 [Xylona heveae TC161]KZF26002.1 hypothetical protein L228DRAFT_2985 [Xylona heveae TC161]